jgi:hypothetical protein
MDLFAITRSPAGRIYSRGVILGKTTKAELNRYDGGYDYLRISASARMRSAPEVRLYHRFRRYKRKWAYLPLLVQTGMPTALRSLVPCTISLACGAGARQAPQARGTFIRSRESRV